MKTVVTPLTLMLALAWSAATHSAADAAALASPTSHPPTSTPPAPVAAWRLPARIVAVGLPGVAGVRQVGRFHGGGAIPGNPEFLLSTHPGRVLAPERVLVAVAGNLGAPAGPPGQAPGAILSIDPDIAETIVVPERLAASGDVSDDAGGDAGGGADGGAVRLYTAQSEAFANRRHNPAARTVELAAASGPRYISINNAFGRPWIANAPAGTRGAGTVSVVDPDGAPLDNAPSADAGGVFAGRLTDRRRVPQDGPAGWFEQWFGERPGPQLTPGGLDAGALGTAFLGPSPDGSGLAVFAVVTADGAVAQVHVRDGVDGLAPAGTVGGGGVSGDLGVIGTAFQWNPDRRLYVADLIRDRIVVLHLGDDGRQFTLTRSDAIADPALAQPVDIAPAVPEVANPRFSSHTTLAGSSDLYAANRGDGSLVRVSQDGEVLARAEIEVPGLGVLGAERLRAIAVSADAQRIWLTVEGELPGWAARAGALIEVAAFDAAGPFGGGGVLVGGGREAVGGGRRAVVGADAVGVEVDVSAVDVSGAGVDAAGAGREAFVKEFSPAEGLGPLFNARACVTCHPGPGGASMDEAHFARRVAWMDPVSGRATAIDHPNSPVARRFAVRGAGRTAPSEAALPRGANVVSLRMPPALFAGARIDDIPDAVIEAQAVAKGDGIKGRVNRVATAGGERRIGRYGWKAQIATLDEMTADAFANELGIVSAIAPPPAVGLLPPPEDDGALPRAVAAFIRTLRLPEASAMSSAPPERAR